jgi:hypothetical protein
MCPRRRSRTRTPSRASRAAAPLIERAGRGMPAHARVCVRVCVRKCMRVRVCVRARV